MKRLIALILVSCSLFSYAKAQSTFTINVFGAEDTIPPTVPVSLEAEAVAFNQVNLEWGPATDNFFVSGYVVFRDAVAIATTTQLTYADTDVLASTTYEYFVTAFDSSGNYSASSSAVSLVTPEQPPTPTPPIDTNTVTEQESTATKIIVESLSVTPSLNGATVAVRTRFPGRFEIRWGKTTDYELGYTINRHFDTDYGTELTGLEPGTQYQYEIVGYTPRGIATILERGSFTTKPASILWSPTNVRRFVAQRDGASVALSWELPDIDFSHVRIVRSNLGFPLHTQDGAIIYQGRGDTFFDKDILSQFSPVYYTIFVIGPSGAVSSGAVAWTFSLTSQDVSDQSSLTTQIPITDIPEDGYMDTPGNDISVPRGENEYLLQPSDIKIEQDNIQYTFLDSDSTLQANKDFVVSVPQSSVPATIRSMVVSVTDPTNSRQSYSFLLRYNTQTERYEAVVPAMGVAGASEIQVAVFDVTTGLVASYEKNVSFILDTETISARAMNRNLFVWYGAVVGGSALVFVGGVFMWVRFRRKRLSEDNTG